MSYNNEDILAADDGYDLLPTYPDSSIILLLCLHNTRLMDATSIGLF